jgi:hypothetical protein
MIPSLDGFLPEPERVKISIFQIERFNINPNFQENIPMKKMLLVLCVIAFASLTASATTGFTVTFNGYCDGMSVATTTTIAFGGVHHNDNCAGDFSNGGGFKHGAAGYTYYIGSAYDFGDPLFGREGINSSLQFLLSVAGTVTHPVHCGWTLYEGPDGVGNYLLNLGTCTIVSRPVRQGGGTKSTTMR